MAVAVADAAAELHLHVAADRPQNRLHRLAVLRFAGKGAVEVDDVQPGEADLHEGARLRRRVVVVDGGVVHLALLQADAFAVLQVDGGEEDHARSSCQEQAGARKGYVGCRPGRSR